MSPKNERTKRGKLPDAPVRLCLGESSLTLRVKGFNRARLLRELINAKIRVKEVINITSDEFYITIPQKEYAKTFAICNSLCYNYAVVEYSGLFQWLKSRVKRLGLVAGALAVAVLFFVTNSFVFNIEILGTQQVAKTEMLNHLKSNGVFIGSRISSLDCDKVRQIVNSYDGVAQCSVAINGHTLLISVTERDQTSDEPQRAKNLYSRFDAIVTRIVCESGTAKVGRGQIVKSGDMLIDGNLYDQNGQVLLDGYAVGKVYGTVTQKRVFVLSQDEYEIVRTGKSKAFTTLSLFGLTLGQCYSPYENYESESSSSKTTLLPIAVKRTVFYETERVLTVRTSEEMIDECVNRARAEFVDDTDAPVEVKTHCKAITENEYEITVYLQTERELT